MISYLHFSNLPPKEQSIGLAKAFSSIEYVSKYVATIVTDIIIVHMLQRALSLTEIYSIIFLFSLSG